MHPVVSVGWLLSLTTGPGKRGTMRVPIRLECCLGIGVARVYPGEVLAGDEPLFGIVSPFSF